jgi:hypothetical protein
MAIYIMTLKKIINPKMMRMKRVTIFLERFELAIVALKVKKSEEDCI